MADTKISNLPAAAPFGGTELVAMVQGAGNVKGTVSQFPTYLAGTFLSRASNLSDLASAATARTNLGVTATGADTAYAFRANNLSDLASVATARTNLGVTATGADTAYAYRANNLSDLANAGTSRTNLGLGSIATFAEVTAAEYRAATAARALSADKVWSAAAVVPLTDAATIALDMSTFFNGSVTLGGNRTLGNPTNPKVGQSGFIQITQDGTGSRTLAYASNYRYAGGIGTIPVLSTAAGSVDILTYLVLTSTSILITGVQKAVA